MGGYFDDSSEEIFDDFDFDDHKMEIIGPIVMVIIIILICTCCSMACKRKREGAIFSTPVVVVSEQHTNAGPYPVTVQQHHHTPNMTAQPYPPMQPQHQQQQMGGMPMPSNYGPYPGMGAGGMPQPQQTPYPPMPQPGAMPMAQNPAMMNPPSYNEVVGNEGYQKQAPYNPSFSS